jgi:hypothetical protein
VSDLAGETAGGAEGEELRVAVAEIMFVFPA